MKTAVFPLSNLTTSPFAGQVMGEVLYTDLKAVPGLVIVPNAESWKTFQGKETDLEEAVLKQDVLSAGRQLGVDAVFYGSVTEYRYRRGIDEEPAVGVSLRLMDVATGKVLWGASLSRTSGCCTFGSESLSAMAQEVSRKLVADFKASAHDSKASSPSTVRPAAVQ